MSAVCDFWLVSYLFDRYQWFRRWRGGHWERWWMDAIQSALWMRVDECSYVSGRAPYALCRGTPTCEEWSKETL